MAYATGNPQTKKKLKELVADGIKIKIFQPGGLFPMKAGPNQTAVEGPHSPEPHKWYARVEYDENFIITRVIG